MNNGFILLSSLLLSTGALYAADDFEAAVLKARDGETLPYQIHKPANMDPFTHYPLVLFLHGAGHRGDDNLQPITKSYGPREILAYATANKIEVIMIVPQCPEAQQWVDVPWSGLSHVMPATPSAPMRLTLEWLNECIKTLPVDEKRIYVTGASMGGFGTWDIIQRHPTLFAAAMPVCGGGDTALAPQIKQIPIWAFHGGNDDAVKTSRSRDMIEALKKAGGTPRYTEYPGVRHDAWTPTYANPAVLKWLFDQSK